MDLQKAVKASLTAARDYVPIKSGRLRYKFIKLSPDGRSIDIRITSDFDYPRYLNTHNLKIRNMSVKGGAYTQGWEDRFGQAFAERLAKNLGGRLR